MYIIDGTDGISSIHFASNTVLYYYRFLYFDMILHVEFCENIFFFGKKSLFFMSHIKTIHAIRNNTGENLLSYVDFEKFVWFAQSVYVLACENEECFVLSFVFAMS